MNILIIKETYIFKVLSLFLPIFLIIASGLIAPPFLKVAAAADCDNWQTLHPDWIYCDDFENRALGRTVGGGVGISNYDSWGGGIVDTPVYGSSTRTLELNAYAGEANTIYPEWSFTTWNGPIYLRWYTKFSNDFEFGHVGSKHIYLKSPDDPFTHAIRIAAKRKNGNGSLPTNEGRLVFSLRCNETDYPANEPDCNNSGGEKYFWPNVGTPINLVGGQWYEIQMMYQPGTTPFTDSIKLWINGILQTDYSNVSLKQSSYTAGWSKLWVTSYFSSNIAYRAPKTEQIYYDNIVISKNPIGALGGGPADPIAPSAPTGLLAAPTSSSQINLSWSASTDNVAVTGYKIYRAGSVVATSPVTSYSDTDLTANTNYSYTVSAIDAAGNESLNSIAVSATTPAGPSQSPYSGTPASIPGKVEIENYDIGGEGIAYHDTTIANSGGQYRTTEGVDIETTTDAGAGYNIGWTQAGEWLEYTVNVVTSGTYDIEARTASNGIGGNLHIEFDGVDKTGAIAVPNTGGWQTYQTLTKTGINLTAGQHIMKIYMDSVGGSGGTGNINFVNFVLKSAAADTTPPSAPTGLVVN